MVVALVEGHKIGWTRYLGLNVLFAQLPLVIKKQGRAISRPRQKMTPLENVFYNSEIHMQDSISAHYL